MLFYIFNSTKAAWLQDDERTWGSFDGVQEFLNRDTAIGIKEREGDRNPNDTLYVFQLAD